MRRHLTSEKVRVYVASKPGPVQDVDIFAWASSTPKGTVNVYLNKVSMYCIERTMISHFVIKPVGVGG